MSIKGKEICGGRVSRWRLCAKHLLCGSYLSSDGHVIAKGSGIWDSHQTPIFHTLRYSWFKLWQPPGSGLQSILGLQRMSRHPWWRRRPSLKGKQWPLGRGSGCTASPMTGSRKTPFSIGKSCYQDIAGPHSKTHRWWQIGTESRVPPPKREVATSAWKDAFLLMGCLGPASGYRDQTLMERDSSTIANSHVSS